MLHDPARGREAILDGGRKPMLGRQPIVYRHNGAAALRRQHAAEPVMGVEIAEHAAAAMKEHQRRQRPGDGLLRPVEAVGQRAARPRQFAVLDLAYCHTLDVDRLRQPAEVVAHLLRRHGGDVGHVAGGGQHIEEPLGGGIERHDELPKRRMPDVESTAEPARQLPQSIARFRPARRVFRASIAEIERKFACAQFSLAASDHQHHLSWLVAAVSTFRLCGNSGDQMPR